MGAYLPAICAVGACLGQQALNVVWKLVASNAYAPASLPYNPVTLQQLVYTLMKNDHLRNIRDKASLYEGNDPIFTRPLYGLQN